MSRVAKVATWKKTIPIRRVGETLFWKSPCTLGLAGVPDEVLAFAGLSWEDKVVKVLQGPFLASVVASLDIGGCTDEKSFTECTISSRLEAIAFRLEAIASRLAAIASRVEVMAIIRMEAIASRLEAIAFRLEAIASRLAAIASRVEVMAIIRLEAVASRLEAIPYLVGGHR